MRVSLGDTIRVTEVDLVDTMCGIEVGQEYKVDGIEFELDYPIIVTLKDGSTHPMGFDQIEVVK